jgi:hypothetical protein
MKKSQIEVFGAVALIAAVSGYLVFTYLQRPQPSFKESVAFVQSVYALVETRMHRGSLLPPSVPISELVHGGYITLETARRFEGSEITFPANKFSEPVSFDRAGEGVLICLRLRDGRQTAMMADGSIQQLPR